MTDEQLHEAVERLLDQRVAQGLPRYVEDPVVLDQIAAMLRAAVPATNPDQGRISVPKRRNAG